MIPNTFARQGALSSWWEWVIENAAKYEQICSVLSWTKDNLSYEKI